MIITPSELMQGAPDNGVFVQIVCSADVKMSVPRWLLNLAMRQFAFLLLWRFQQAVELTYDEDYQARMCDPNNPFYQLMRRRIAEELPEQCALIPPLRGEPVSGLRTG